MEKTNQGNGEIVTMEKVTKRRSQGGVTFELKIPELTILAGQFVAIVGDSGCGKSTLLDMLALVSRPTRYERFLCQFPDNSSENPRIMDIGQLWSTDDEQTLAGLRKAQLGYVLQTGGLLPFLTVRQNLHLPTRINGLSDYSYITALAERFGLTQLLGKKPQYLSGGQRQRVAILRALAHHPRIILADEPTAAVDKKRAHEIVGDFNRLAKENGTTVVMVTHDHGLVEGIADISYSFAVETVSETFTCSTTHLL